MKNGKKLKTKYDSNSNKHQYCLLNISEITESNHYIEGIINAVKLLRENGIKTGIGMTILDDNIDDIKPIMELSDQLGANFFRAIPVVSIGKAKDINIDQDFYVKALIKVMEAAKDIQSVYFSTVLLPDDLTNLDKNILIECPVGKSTLSIDSIGDVKTCVLDNNIVGSIKKDTLSVLYKKILEKSLNEQEALQNDCLDCNARKLCKGGCQIERKLRNTKELERNPICMRAIWKNAHEKIIQTKELRKLINNMICLYNTHDYYKIPMCYRSSPLWWYPLDGNKKISMEAIRYE